MKDGPRVTQITRSYHLHETAFLSNRPSLAGAFNIRGGVRSTTDTPTDTERVGRTRRKMGTERQRVAQRSSGWLLYTDHRTSLNAKARRKNNDLAIGSKVTKEPREQAPIENNCTDPRKPGRRNGENLTSNRAFNF